MIKTICNLLLAFVVHFHAKELESNTINKAQKLVDRSLADELSDNMVDYLVDSLEKLALKHVSTQLVPTVADLDFSFQEVLKSIAKQTEPIIEEMLADPNIQGMQEQSKSLAQKLEVLRGDPSFQKQIKIISAQVEATMADADLPLQEISTRIAEQMQLAIDVMLTNPHVKDLQRQTALLAEHMEAMKDDPGFQKRVEALFDQMSTMMMDRNLQRYANRIVKDLEAMVVLHNPLSQEKQEHRIAGQIEEIMAGPSFHEGVERIARQTGGIKVFEEMRTTSKVEEKPTRVGGQMIPRRLKAKHVEDDIESGIPHDRKKTVDAPSSNPIAKAIHMLRTGDPAVLGHACLFAVPLLWGTESPALRYIYNLKPNEPHPAELCAIRSMIATGTLVGPALLKTRKGGMSNRTMLRDVARAGLECGTICCFGQAFQAFGISHTTGTNAGFILTLINILIPLMFTVRGHYISPTVWTSLAVSLLGVGIMDLPLIRGLAKSGAPSRSQLLWGDSFVMLGCIMYAWLTVRIGDLSPGRDSTLLTLWNKAAMAFGSILWDGADKVVRREGVFSTGLWRGSKSTVSHAWAALLWSSLVPGTLATVLQMRAQAHVSAVESQLVFATTPVFNTIFATLVLGEKPSAYTLGGGAVIFTAAFMPTLWPLLLDKIKASRSRKKQKLED